MDEYATSLLFQGKLWCDHFGKHIDMSRLLQLLSDQVKALRKPRERVMKTLQTISRERNDAPAHKASNYKSTLERALKKVHNLINDPLSTSIQVSFLHLSSLFCFVDLTFIVIDRISLLPYEHLVMILLIQLWLSNMEISIRCIIINNKVAQILPQLRQLCKE